MHSPQKLFLYVWTGSDPDARAFAQQRYPDAAIVPLSHREVRGSTWRDQVRILRSLHGRAIVFFFQSLEDAHYRRLLLWTGLLHRCHETVIADASGRVETYRRRDWLWLFPLTLLSALLDAFVLSSSWLSLSWMKIRGGTHSGGSRESDFDVAYLYAYPMNRSSAPGGAMTHIGGVLRGLQKNGATGEVFSACSLPADGFPLHVVEPRERPSLFWESRVLSYNRRFARSVRSALAGKKPRFLYQRHMQFVVAGALLARWLQVPLILEFNGSTVWVAKNWDPARFTSWLKICEDISLSAAFLIVVVSDALRDDLVERGIPTSKILVNPNGVDPDFFQPGNGQKRRQQLGVQADDVLVGFAGTFGPWHGVQVLQQAILDLLHEQHSRPGKGKRLRFLLIGEGLLYPVVCESLKQGIEASEVILTGVIPHAQMPSYLDACDILVSPHVPMDRPFFGSPTKLFEYMAMRKAIVASRLGQIAQVLEHDHTAWLVEPGNPKELASAIVLLAENPELRERLGRSARAAAVAQYSWVQNVQRVLARISQNGGMPGDGRPEAVTAFQSRTSGSNS